MSMFYVKNVPGWERALRGLVGVLMLLGAALLLSMGNPLGYVVGASGLMAIMSGFFGFCPMCALAGRRLKARS
jgi:hypothetical protein